MQAKERLVRARLRIRNQIWRQVSDRVWNKVGRRVSDPIRDLVWDEVMISVFTRAREEVDAD